MSPTNAVVRDQRDAMYRKRQGPPHWLTIPVAVGIGTICLVTAKRSHDILCGVTVSGGLLALTLMNGWITSRADRFVARVDRRGITIARNRRLKRRTLRWNNITSIDIGRGCIALRAGRFCTTWLSVQFYGRGSYNLLVEAMRPYLEDSFDLCHLSSTTEKLPHSRVSLRRIALVTPVICAAAAACWHTAMAAITTDDTNLFRFARIQMGLIIAIPTLYGLALGWKLRPVRVRRR